MFNAQRYVSRPSNFKIPVFQTVHYFTLLAPRIKQNEPQLNAAARMKDRIRAYLQNGESERRLAITFGISSST